METEQRKYEFTGETIWIPGWRVYRIRALRDFGNVKAGDIGGWIESESNLSHEGNCWVSGEAKVYAKLKSMTMLGLAAMLRFVERLRSG